MKKKIYIIAIVAITCFAAAGGATVLKRTSIHKEMVCTLSATAAPVQNVSCNGGNNGGAQATVTGGTTPYTFSWYNGINIVSNSNPTGNNLSAGSYTVTVTDAAQCMATAAVTIIAPPAISISIAPTPVTCYDAANGQGAATVNGGTTPYTFKWITKNNSNFPNAATIGPVRGGSYTLTVTDAQGCTMTAERYIDYPATMQVATQNITPVSCNGGNNGSSEVIVAHGTPPYNYKWNDALNQTTSAATGLSAGNYSVAITDANGCNKIVPVMVYQPSLLTAPITRTINVTKYGGSNGLIRTVPTGGKFPYYYQWSNGQSDMFSTGLTAGAYTVTVTDANGCSITSSATITQPALALGVNPLNYTSPPLEIYPDPTSGQITITGANSGQIMELSDYNGQIISTIVMSGTPAHFDLTDKPNGVYFIRTITKDGVFIRKQSFIKMN